MRWLLTDIVDEVTFAVARINELVGFWDFNGCIVCSIRPNAHGHIEWSMVSQTMSGCNDPTMENNGNKNFEYF